MPTPAYCQSVYDQLMFNGFPNSAKQMAGEPHNNGAFLEEKPKLTPDLTKAMQECAGINGKQMIERAVRNQTPAERAESKKRTKKKMKDAGYDKKPGKWVAQDAGTTDSSQDYNDIIEAIDKEESPFGFLMGSTFGVPNWALYAGGAYLIYAVVIKAAERK